jgi:predicted ATP-grasp superfamily ATP-dependent carboligase
MSIPEYILIIASSVRLLAQAAKNAGLKPLVIDIFVDRDTQQYAEAFKRVSSLSETQLTSVVDHFIQRYGVTHVIYGSGFEYYPESLRYLDNKLIVLGNSIDTFLRTQDKSDFFSSLDKLSIPYPEVCFVAPNNQAGWLVKPIQGQGGLGIQRYRPKQQVRSLVYWQKFQAGAQYSVLFLADGKSAQMIGFNTQWTIDLGEGREFIFSGIINSCELLNEDKERITDWLHKLACEFRLKGLNSLDFIQADDKIFVLEINPRPSASMQLYDADLLSRHIKSSQGQLTDYAPSKKGYTGYQIVYAKQDITIPYAFEWPNGCMDLPEFGVTYRTGEPVCSIIAHQKQAHLVMNELKIKQLNLIKGFNIHGI